LEVASAFTATADARSLREAVGFRQRVADLLRGVVCGWDN
jgi:hypothetical protein